MVEKISAFVHSLSGVLDTVFLRDEDRKVVLDLENDYEKSQEIKLVNTGIRSVMEREKVLSVLKDPSFRNPPFPTVLLVEEFSGDTASDHVYFLDGKNYRIVGEELLGSNEPIKEDHVSIGSGFVMYPGRREGREHIPSYFIMPSIGFPELEEMKNFLSIDSIVSASPSSLSDDYIRNTYGLPLDNQLATILIGFDLKSF